MARQDFQNAVLSFSYEDSHIASYYDFLASVERIQSGVQDLDEDTDANLRERADSQDMPVPLVIRDDEKYQAFWPEMAGEEPPFEALPEGKMLVVMFLGEKALDTHDLSFTGSEIDDGTLYVDFRVDIDPDPEDPELAFEDTRAPFAVAYVPFFAGPVEFVHGNQDEALAKEITLEMRRRQSDSLIDSLAGSLVPDNDKPTLKGL